jgi:hypothetical protein
LPIASFRDTQHIRGEADINWQARPAASVADDPVEVCAYVKRFGSLTRAYNLIGFKVDRHPCRKRKRKPWNGKGIADGLFDVIRVIDNG